LQTGGQKTKKGQDFHLHPFHTSLTLMMLARQDTVQSPLKFSHSELCFRFKSPLQLCFPAPWCLVNFPRQRPNFRSTVFLSLGDSKVDLTH